MSNYNHTLIRVSNSEDMEKAIEFYESKGCTLWAGATTKRREVQDGSRVIRTVDTSSRGNILINEGNSGDRDITEEFREWCKERDKPAESDEATKATESTKATRSSMNTFQTAPAFDIHHLPDSFLATFPRGHLGKVDEVIRTTQDIHELEGYLQEINFMTERTHVVSGSEDVVIQDLKVGRRHTPCSTSIVLDGEKLLEAFREEAENKRNEEALANHKVQPVGMKGTRIAVTSQEELDEAIQFYTRNGVQDIMVRDAKYHSNKPFVYVVNQDIWYDTDDSSCSGYNGCNKTPAGWDGSWGQSNQSNQSNRGNQEREKPTRYGHNLGEGAIVKVDTKYTPVLLVDLATCGYKTKKGSHLRNLNDSNRYVFINVTNRTVSTTASRDVWVSVQADILDVACKTKSDINSYLNSVREDAKSTDKREETLQVPRVPHDTLLSGNPVESILVDDICKATDQRIVDMAVKQVKHTTENNLALARDGSIVPPRDPYQLNLTKHKKLVDLI